MEKKHNNLYYLFQQDQAAHPMPKEKVEQINALLWDIFSKKSPPENNFSKM